MRKKLLTTGIALVSCLSMYAGDLVTNTNQNAIFLRNPARDASTEIDAAYTNPAGLAFLKKDGFFLSVSNQAAFQTRTITSTFLPFAGGPGGSATKAFEGKAQSLVIPNLQAAYKLNKWVISANVGIVGGGGTLDFSKGLPSFESQVALLPLMLSGNSIPTTQYDLDSRLKGTSAIYGIQLGVTYKISDQFSAYLGGRASIVTTKYEGYIRNIRANVMGGPLQNVSSFLLEQILPPLTNLNNSYMQPIIDSGHGDVPLAGVLSPAQIAGIAAGLGLSTDAVGKMTANNFIEKAEQVNEYAAQTADKELNCKQNGSGIAPIIGFNYNWNGLNIGVKYEFKSAVTVKNKTATNTTGMADYNDGAETPYDIPAMFSVGAKYDITSQWTVSAGYHHFFDSDAKMAEIDDPNHPGQKIGKQKLITSGDNEYLAGVEYRINKLFLVSCGTEITRQGVNDAYQSDMSYAINSYSIGLGGAINLTENIRLNLAYLFTNYSNWPVGPYKYAGTTIDKTDVYSKTNKAFGISLDFRF